MKVHFIAIGGSAMHNLAIALSRKGYMVTGSDDEIFQPSKGRLEKEGILPKHIGWNTELISPDLDAVIVGMHARKDNPELAKAKELGLKIYSYPEYLFEQSRNKKRVVIGGSHGKTTVTAMILHALQKCGISFDYMVGAQLDGYDCMVQLTDKNDLIILEGDEYLSSPLDPRPKFHLYEPHIALITGIAWDHINVFPSFENYVSQFELFCAKIVSNGTLIYNEEDETVRKIALSHSKGLQTIPYHTPIYKTSKEGTVLEWEGQPYELSIFGAHNLQNLIGAMRVCEQLGVSSDSFLKAMNDFRGAGKRLEKVFENDTFTLFKDFAHSPSKLKATTKAVKEQYATKKVIACMELHTFSSLKKDFLPQYQGSMSHADKAIVYFSPKVVAHKKLPMITVDDVAQAFGNNVIVVTQTSEVLDHLIAEDWSDSVLLMMSSGNFDGIDYDDLALKLAK